MGSPDPWSTDAGSSGDSALKRFDRDVVAQTGARTVVLLQGINDIGSTKARSTPTR